MPSFYHDPGALETFTIDWSRDLDDDETISTSTWTLDTGISNAAAGNDTTTTSISISGGTAGTTYRARNDITTSAAKTYNRTLFIICERSV